MLDTAGTDELRALQARAYGRGGRLTDAEAARLRELELIRAVRSDATAELPSAAELPKAAEVRIAAELPSAAEVPKAAELPSAAELPKAAVLREEDTRSGGGIAAEAPPERQISARKRARVDAGGPSGGEGHADRAGGADAGEASGADDPAERARDGAESSPRASAGRLRSHLRMLVIVAVLIAAAGVGLGWLLFGDRGAPGIQLTPEQQQWQNRLLASAEYDAGSLRAVGEEVGVVVWYATKKDGELVCVILSDGENTRPSCTTATDSAIQGLHGQFRTPDGENERQIDAQVLLDEEGDPAVTVSSYLLNGEILEFPFATDEEADAAAKLGEAGFDPQTLWIVGRDGDTPLWSAVRPATSEQCLIYDGSEPDPDMICDDAETLWQGGGSLVLDEIDAETGDLTRFEYVFGGGASYLTITKGIERGDVSD